MQGDQLIAIGDQELIPISALSQYAYCPRRCALIHIEQIWSENRFTAEGRIMHEHVHEEGGESRGNCRTEHGVSLRSFRLGLIGKADVVEYYKQPDESWMPFPVEYKRGKPKSDHSDKIQLCAQALCLEEMLDTHITGGSLFYGQTRHRLDVTFDTILRHEVEEAAQQVHALIESGKTPKPVYEKRCESCSIVDECLPKSIQKKRSVQLYLARITKEQ